MGGAADRVIRSSLVIVAYSFALLIWAGAAHAKNCGGLPPPCGTGVIVCECGDTVTESYLLSSSLDCSSHSGLFGLKIASNVTLALNAASAEIKGNQLPNSVGILLDGVSGAQVLGHKNSDGSVDWLKVTGWNRGVQLTNNADDNRIEWVEAYGNGTGTGGYGFDLRVGGTSGNLLTSVWAHDNSDEGVHIGGGADNNTLQLSAAQHNTNTQIYLTGNTQNKILSNWAVGVTMGKGGIRLVNTTYTQVDGNAVLNADILLDTNSSFNSLNQNNMHDGRIEFGDGVHDNWVGALTVDGSTNHCVEFSSNTVLPYNNRITASQLRCTSTPREIISGGSGMASTQNRVCNTQCYHQGSYRLCVDDGSSNDDVRDDREIITLQSTDCF